MPEVVAKLERAEPAEAMRIRKFVFTPDAQRALMGQHARAHQRRAVDFACVYVLVHSKAMRALQDAC